MPAYRNDRISEEVRKQLARIIRDEVKNPNIPADKLTVLSAEVSRDLSHAKIKISIYGDAAEKDAALKALRSAEGFIRRELGRGLTTRIVPDLQFILDDSVEYSIHIQKMLDEIKKDGSDDRA